MTATTVGTQAIVWRTCPIAEGSGTSVAGRLRDVGASGRARAAEIPHPAARARFVAGRALLHGMVAERRPHRHGTELGIEVDGSGRPHPCASDGLEVSVSHTHGLAVAAVSPVGTIGIDVEPLTRTDLPATRVWLTARELRRIAALPAPERRMQLLHLWVAKEATFKACRRVGTATLRGTEVQGRCVGDGAPVGGDAAAVSELGRIDDAPGAVRVGQGRALVTFDAADPLTLTAEIAWYTVADGFLVALATAVSAPPR